MVYSTEINKYEFYLVTVYDILTHHDNEFCVYAAFPIVYSKQKLNFRLNKSKFRHKEASAKGHNHNKVVL